MINQEILKKEVYKKEKRKLIFRFLFFNIIIFLVLSVSLSSNVFTQKEMNLLNMNRELAFERDSLKNLVNNEIRLIKEKENELIKNSLGISSDTTFNNVDLSTKKLYLYTEELNKNFDNYYNIIEIKWDSIYRVPSGMPISSVDFKNLSDKYGYRKHPIYKRWIFHEGVDISAKVGCDIFSTADGIVEKVIISNNGYGNRIVINHGNGYKTLYAHLSGFNVKKGQKVKRKDVIGYIGNTGTSTGPHVHYEVLLNNRPVDPSKYFYLNYEHIALK